MNCKDCKFANNDVEKEPCLNCDMWSNWKTNQF